MTLYITVSWYGNRALGRPRTTVGGAYGSPQISRFNRIPTVFTLCNMHLKLMHYRSNFASILGRFLVYIELNLNAKQLVLSVDFICKMQWFLIYIARRFHAYWARISCIQLRLQRLDIWLDSTDLYILNILYVISKSAAQPTCM